MFNTINSLVSQAIESPDFYSGGTSTPSRNVLSGNIMAGASWNSTNTALQEALTKATGQPTQNFAVPGSTTSDTLKQLNDFIGGGGSFAPGATVFLQAGGVDFLNGVDKGTIKDNLNNIVSTLGNSGVKVVMTGSPYATSIADVQNNNFNPEVDPIYKEIA
jgi:lysophospholipase L1-like esterase